MEKTLGYNDLLAAYSAAEKELSRLRKLNAKAFDVVTLARQLTSYQWEDRLDDSKVSDDAKHDSRELSIAVWLFDQEEKKP